MIVEKIIKSILILLIVVIPSVFNFSCSLNPLAGFLNSLNVKIISNNSMAIKKNIKINQNNINIAAVPSSTPTKVSDFDCIAFSVTGYGIDEKPNVEGSQIPFEALRIGYETPMQTLTGNTDLIFNVQIPSLLGVDSRLQKRLVQILGVYTSLTDKSSCVGKNLSDFLIKEDPNAAVYLTGSTYFPSESGGCAQSDLCINDGIQHGEITPNELIYQNLFSNEIKPSFYYRSVSDLAGVFLFNDSDVKLSNGLEYMPNSGVTSKPSLNSQVARLDFYFPVSQYLKTRAVGITNIEFQNIRAEEYNLSSSLCTSTPVGSTYSTVQFKIWDGLNSNWVNIPRNSFTTDLTLASANSFSYSINFVELTNSLVQPVTIDGTEYLILSVRSQQTSCSSLYINYPAITFH